MDDDVRRRLGRSFGPVAEAYDRGRPPFPREAAAWLVGRDAATVLELGAGTGKLTRQLVALGHDVHASEPDPDMLAVLRRNLPDVRVSESGAEDIPLPDRSVDVVVAAQSFHWFDHDKALPEIARVLRPGGALALVWNLRDEAIPWVRKLGRILHNTETQERVEGAVGALVQSPLFGFVDQEGFKLWQEVDRESIVDLAASRSYVATLDDEGRATKLAEVLELYDDYGRGMDGMRLPYRCECYRAVVVDGDPDDAGGAHAGEGRATETPAGPSDGTDTDMLLIDFR
jgi:ubiquinone/menaquinone biosynthesis C-methylase UbiE